jgi:hypothetical protein
MKEEEQRQEKAEAKMYAIRNWFRRRRKGDEQPDQYQPFG